MANCGYYPSLPQVPTFLPHQGGWWNWNQSMGNYSTNHCMFQDQEDVKFQPHKRLSSYPEDLELNVAGDENFGYDPYPNACLSPHTMEDFKYSLRNQGDTEMEISEMFSSYDNLFQKERQTNSDYFESLHHELSTFQQSMTKEMSSLKNIMENLVITVNTPRTTEVLLPRLPLTNELELQAFEEWLANSSNFNTALAVLSRCPGSTSGRIVRSILKKLFSDELGGKCTFLGKNAKICFKNLQCYKLLVDATRRHLLVQCISDMEINNIVSDWLRTSNTRISMRNRRDSGNSRRVNPQSTGRNLSESD